MNADKFTWKPGDIIVAGCPECQRLADRMLDASSAEEVEQFESEYAEHAKTHDQPRKLKTGTFDEFRKFLTEPG